MSHFNQYGNYYDPVGTQSSRPAGYTYSTSPSTAAYPTAASSGYGSGYGSNYQRADANAYDTEQYRTNATSQHASSSATHAAAALSSLSSTNYNQASAGSRTGSSNQYDNNAWYAPGTSNSNVYSGSSMSVPNRTQSNNSPIYGTAQSSSTFGRLSVPDQSQNTTSAYAATSSAPSQRSYQTAYTQPQTQTQPPRYNSPLHAVQAQQHGHGKQSSRTSNQVASPQMAQASQSAQQNRQQSASVEPTSMTVDPSQVYDNRAELQRKAQIEAERRRKQEAEQAAKKAEEARLATEKQKEEEAKQAAAKKAEQERKNAQRKKAREDKKQSKSAANTLAQMASSMVEASTSGGGDDEVQMREMFKRMREFNQKNPDLLAKLWDEERKTHEAAKTVPSPQQPAVIATSPAPAATKTATPTQKQAGKAAARTTSQAKGPSTLPAAQSLQERAAATLKSDKPVAAAGSTSLWPHHKKSGLSEATAKWLNTMPQNSNTHVTPAAILTILNDNPSYVELCRSLEKLGLKFDRSQLARELLKAVPDGIKGQPGVPQPTTPLTASVTSQVNGSSALPGQSQGRSHAQKNTSNQQAARPSSSTGLTVIYEAPLSLSDAAREVNSMGRQFSHQSVQAYQTPFTSKPQTLANSSRPQSQSQPQPQPQSQPEIKQEMKPVEPPRAPPADKEEAARKRTFGDLVDLTAEDSDDEGPPQKKVMQAPTVPSNGAANHSQSLQKPVAFNQYMFKPTGQSMATSPYFNQPLNGQMPRPAMPGQQQALNGQQMNRPTPPPPPKQKGPSHEQLQQVRMRGKMLVEPIMRDRVARKSNYDSRTIARDVLLATGRHPDMRGLNAHLVGIQKLLSAHGGEFDGSGNKSDLATIKWDVIDPAPPKEEKEKKQAQASDTPKEQTAASTNGVMSNNIPRFGSPAIPEDRLLKPPTRRGRPPKQRESAPMTNGLGAPDSGSNSPTPARQTSSRPATPSSAPNMASTAGVGYASFQQINPDGTKKKGRPFGWKKTLHSREAQGLPKAVNPSQTRPKQSSSTPKQVQEVGPTYQEYKCQWDGCQSSLMNLDTLKKHLVKVHGRPDDGRYTCLWQDCKGVKKQGPGGGRVAARYNNIEDWVKHVNDAHVNPIAWKLGDGPRGGVAYDNSLFYSPETTPSYLTDSRGRSVTPVITPPAPTPSKPTATPTSTPLAPASATAPETTASSSQLAVRPRGRPRKDGEPPRAGGAVASGSNIGSIEKDPELRKLADHQRLVGPLLDRMGCVLASEERRLTFLDDEDFEDEVEGSEHDATDWRDG